MQNMPATIPSAPHGMKRSCSHSEQISAPVEAMSRMKEAAASAQYARRAWARPRFRDDNSLFRHKDYPDMRDPSQENPLDLAKPWAVSSIGAFFGPP
jgi:hypothetical protein